MRISWWKSSELAHKEWGGSLKDWVEEMEWYKELGYKLSIDGSPQDPTGIIIYRSGFPPGCTNVGYIIVKRRFRRRGIGSRLLRKAETYAKRKGDFLVFVDTDHESTLPFWRQRGYRAVDRLVLTLPDEPLSYLMLKPLEEIKLTRDILSELMKGYIKEIYDERERRIFGKYFQLIFSQIEGLPEVRLTSDLFLEDYPVIECRKLGTPKIREIISDISKRRSGQSSPV